MDSGEGRHVPHHSSRTRRSAPRARRAVSLLTVLLLAALALTGCQVQNSGSWQALNTPFGRTVYALAPDPHVPQLLYAGTSSGEVFRARIESSAAQAGAGIPTDATVAALVADPSHAGVVYAGTSRGAYSTGDYGDNWRARSSGLPTDDGVDALALGAATAAGPSLFAGTIEHGVYVSQNAGATWQASGNGLPSGSGVFGLLYDAPVGTLYAALAAKGVYASTDGGQTWVARSSGLPANTDTFALLALPATGASAAGQTLFAGTGKGVFASADGGQTWHAAGLDQMRVAVLAPDPTNSTTLYAGADDNVYRSADSGKSWVVVAPGIQQAVNAIVVLADQHGRPIVFVGTTQILRYPAIPGSSGGLGTIVSILIFLLLAGMLFYFTRRSRRMVERMITPPTPPGGDARPGTGAAREPGSQDGDARTQRRTELN